ncbi:hypothetical protein BDZ91DRAFT_10703 [Kalaharituber pfeilii]|nr:hypothetical protein BDZ91DRAFT_10703 [Kalaharituber pfeilii]
MSGEAVPLSLVVVVYMVPFVAFLSASATFNGASCSASFLTDSLSNFKKSSCFLFTNFSAIFVTLLSIQYLCSKIRICTQLSQ